MAATELGWVGLGRMGQAMAKRLQAEGHPLAVFNRTAAASEALAAGGARVALRPADVAGPGGMVVSMLADEAAVVAVCEGPEGLLANLRGGTHVSMSTLSPEAALRLARRHQEAGVGYVSAPVQGRPAMSEHGQLAAWVSGPEPASLDAVLRSLCRKVIRLGPDVRSAAAAKLALNLLMNANIALFAEAFAYAKEQGVDPTAFGEGLTETAFAAPLFKAIVGGLLGADDAAHGSDVALSRKDLALLLASAGDDRALTVARSVHGVFADAAARGWGALDPVAVRRLYRTRK
jgi:3-hydroxyisobutyrate dehydrogenase-like beta-hydroxyacid dehydrogenase